MNKAIFTIVKNERFFLDVWYKYYSQHFEQKDIYILNHDTTDGSIDKYRNLANIIDLKHEIHFDHVWLRHVVESFQKELLDTYDVVCFTEVDEFIIPRNELLSDYLESFAKSENQYVTCLGFELLDNCLYDPRKKILAQKTWFRANPRFMNKTLITKIPLSYEKGFHSHSQPDNLDHNLINLHLHYFDYIVFMERVKSRIIHSDKFEHGVDGVQNKYKTMESYFQDFQINQGVDSYLDLPKVI